MTDQDIIAAWEAANEAGYGLIVGEQRMTLDQAAEAECLLNIRSFRDSRLNRFVVGENAKGHLIAIKDVNGPWAQDVTAWSER